MKKTNEEYSLLYDYYGTLLSERQRDVFGLYYEENLSLSEVAESIGVSRQAVHIALGKASEELEIFEEKLGLVEKHRAYEKTVKEVDERIGAWLKDKAFAAGAGPEAAKDLRRIKKLVRELDI